MSVKVLLVFLFYCTCFNLNAQSNQIIVFSDPKLDSLIEYNKQLHAGIQTQYGFRIQLFNGTNRSQAEELKTDFFKKYPHIPAYLSYQQPYFKLRIGDFKTRFEALKLYKQLQHSYEQIIIVPDKINLHK